MSLYIVSTLDNLIATKPEYAGITYEYLQCSHSSEIGTVIFNYPGTVQLTGEDKKASFREGSPFWQCVDLASNDKDAHFPQVLYIYEKDVVGDLKRRQSTHGRSEQGEKRQKQRKRARKKKAKKAPELDGEGPVVTPT